MNQFGFTQLDSLLNFSKLHLLVFTPQWNLIGLHPNHRSFLGWDEGDIKIYRFDDNFLRPNSLDLATFLGHFQQKSYVVKNYYWRDSEKRITGPFETYFRLRKENNYLKTVMAFIKLDHGNEKLEIPPAEKNKIFLSEPLPGFLHNLFGPLGSISGRLEVLIEKSSESDELQDLLQLTLQVQESLKILRNKLTNERHTQPIVIDLNDFIRQELQYLKSDMFFKHQVKVNTKLDLRIQKSKLFYASLSGILGEFYYYMRRFVSEEAEYTLQVETLAEYDRLGFHLNFLGDFKIPSELSVRFPIDLEGEANQIALQSVEGLDVIFLDYCLQMISGYLELTGRRDMMKLRLTLPGNKE
jgi:hypothetical protein